MLFDFFLDLLKFPNGHGYVRTVQNIDFYMVKRAAQTGPLVLISIFESGNRVKFDRAGTHSGEFE